MNTVYKNLDDENVIDLSALIAKVWEGRWWIFGSVIFFTAAFVVAAIKITPIYRSSVVLLSASSDRGSGGVLGSALGQLSGLASLAGVSVGSSDSETEEALAVLRSRQFTESFIVENDLMPELFADKWDASKKEWRVDKVDRPTVAKAYQYFNKQVRLVTQDKKTGLVSLQIDWKDRNKAALWANELVKRLNSEMRDRAIAKANASIGYLQNELKVTMVVGTQEAINRLIEAQIKQKMLASVSPDYAFRVVDKAMVADVDDPVKPNKVLFAVAGFVLGLVFGLLFVWISHSIQASRLRHAKDM